MRQAYGEQIDYSLIPLESTDQADQFAVLVVQAFAHATGWIELKPEFHVNNYITVLTLTEEIFKAYPQSLYTLTKGISLPMAVPPKPWSRTEVGGYLFKEESIKLRKELNEAIYSKTKYKRFSHEDLTRADTDKL